MMLYSDPKTKVYVPILYNVAIFEQENVRAFQAACPVGVILAVVGMTGSREVMPVLFGHFPAENAPSWYLLISWLIDALPDYALLQKARNPRADKFALDALELAYPILDVLSGISDLGSALEQIFTELLPGLLRRLDVVHRLVLSIRVHAYNCHTVIRLRLGVTQAVVPVCFRVRPLHFIVLIFFNVDLRSVEYYRPAQASSQCPSCRGWMSVVQYRGSDT